MLLVAIAEPQPKVLNFTSFRILFSTLTQIEVTAEISETDVSSATATEIPPTNEEPKQEEPVSEKPSELEASQAAQQDLRGGVIMYGKKVSGVFRKGFWGIFSIAILPPILVFAFGILVIICML